MKVCLYNETYPYSRYGEENSDIILVNYFIKLYNVRVHPFIVSNRKLPFRIRLQQLVITFVRDSNE